MPLIEGKGLVPPRPERVRIHEHEIKRLRQAAARIREYRRYSCRQDQWGRGLIDDPVFLGLMGEQVVVSFLNERLQGELPVKLSVDTSLLPNGDFGKDIFVFQQRIQVKNRRGGDSLLVRRERPSWGWDGGRIVPIAADLFVKASYSDGSFGTVDGWIRTKAILHMQFTSARKGNHFNLEVPDERLWEPRDLITHLLNVKEDQDGFDNSLSRQ